MIKRVLIFCFFIFSMLVYGQKYDVEINNKQEQATISQVSAYPNPFNVESQIIFQSKSTQTILFEVKNILGKRVYNKEILALQGENIISFFKNKLASGMYIYSIQTDTETISKRLVIK